MALLRHAPCLVNVETLHVLAVLDHKLRLSNSRATTETLIFAARFDP